MEKISTYVKIPRERIGALIGPKGLIKEKVEEELYVRLQVDSETGRVMIVLSPDAQDPSLIFRAKELITAIGRGFSPGRAFRLIEDDDTILEIIDLREIVGSSHSDLNRLKGRIIGKEGKARKMIEDLTEAEVSVYGHTVSIIGSSEQVEVAREAIYILIRGRQHRTAYRFLQRKRRELKRKEMELWETKKQ